MQQSCSFEQKEPLLNRFPIGSETARAILAIPNGTRVPDEVDEKPPNSIDVDATISEIAKDCSLDHVLTDPNKRPFACGRREGMLGKSTGLEIAIEEGGISPESSFN